MVWPDVATYWPQVATDLTSVTWSHATNSQDLLDTALADTTMMIEADVSEGEGRIPIMAHPPANTSDLSLEKFLTDILSATNDTDTKKGIKLDFKDITIVETSLIMIEKMTITIPLWLNADVLRGPGDSSSPVDPDQFLTLYQKHLPLATLSLGWTTTAAPGQYSSGEFKDLEDLLAKHNHTTPITLPLRASLAAQSRPDIVNYLARSAGTSLTIWSGASDSVDVDKLVMMIGEVGKERVYLDVPQDLEDKMANNGATTFGISAARGAVLLAVIIALFL